MNSQPTDVVFETDGLTYRGLAWGDTSKPLVFAIHGWLDNALSFAVLAPLLSNYRVISIDLSGHGLSSHRSADANYHIWDDIPQLVAVIDQLSVNEAHIVGHSRGAAVAGMLAVALDKRCLSLTMLDGMISRSFENDNGAELFRTSLAERKKYMALPPRIFESVEQFIDSRSRYGFTRKNSQVLLPRALRRVDEGWLLLSDPKLFGSSTLKMSEETSDSLYRAMNFPVAAITGDTGFFTSEEAQQRMTDIANFAPNFRQLTVSGPHHFHIEGDVAFLASRLTRFFEKGELVTDLLEQAS